MAVATFTKAGTKATTPAKLDKAIFGVEVKNHELLKQAYTLYLANRRSAHAKSKKRGEVRGGGIKPWRQKGTGRARFGSSRNPLWRGGGVAFGPTGNENYTKKLSIKAKQQALRQALSLAATADRIKVIEDFVVTDGKVKSTVSLLNKLAAAGMTLVIVDKKDEVVDRATRNLPEVKLVSANYLTVYDLLNADTVVITKKALEVVNGWLGAPTKTRSKEAANV